MNEDTMRQIAQEVIDNNQQTDQFAVSQTPFHIHNGSDSPKIHYINLSEKIVIIPQTIQGINAETSTNYSTFFTAPYPMTVIGITEVHTTLGTNGAAVTVQVEKLTGTTVPGSGVPLLTTALSLKSTINTVVSGVLSTAIGAIQLNVGDRLALKSSGVLTAVANVTVVVTLQF